MPKHDGSFGERLELARQMRLLSRERLAQLSGAISARTIERMEESGTFTGQPAKLLLVLSGLHRESPLQAQEMESLRGPFTVDYLRKRIGEPGGHPLGAVPAGELEEIDAVRLATERLERLLGRRPCAAMIHALCDAVETGLLSVLQARQRALPAPPPGSVAFDTPEGRVYSPIARTPAPSSAGAPRPRRAVGG